MAGICLEENANNYTITVFRMKSDTHGTKMEIKFHFKHVTL